MKFIVRVLALVMFFGAASRIRSTSKNSRLASWIIIFATALIVFATVFEWTAPEVIDHVK